jgi:hypothetical protein
MKSKILLSLFVIVLFLFTAMFVAEGLLHRVPISGYEGFTLDQSQQVHELLVDEVAKLKNNTVLVLGAISLNFIRTLILIWRRSVK